MPGRFNHKKIRGVGLHSITREKGVRDSKGPFTGYARVVDTTNIDRKQFDHAIKETLRTCPIGKEVVAFVPSELMFKSRQKPSDVGLDHVVTSDFQLWRESIGVARDKLPPKVREGIEKGWISEHLVDLPGFKGDEKEVVAAIQKRTGMKQGEPHWGYELVEEVMIRRHKKLMDALRKHPK